MHALSVSLLRAKQLPVITNGLGASPHAGRTCTIGVVTVRPLNRLPARLYFKLKPDPNNTFFFIFTCTTQYPWVLANLNLSQAMAPSKKKRTHTVFRDSSAYRSASTSKPRFVGEKQPLENRVDYVRGVTYKAAVDLHEELDDSSYVLLRANNIQDGELRFDDVQYVDRAKVKQKQLLRRGDILFCASSGSKGLVGKAALVRENMPVTFGAFCCVLRPKENEAEYLAHYFQSQQYRRAIEKVCSGSNINNLKAANFFSLVVPHYDDDSTHVISALFDSIDAQIKHAKDQIANLDSLVKSRFVEMFSGVDQTRPLEKLIVPKTRISYGIVQPGPEGTGDMGILRPVDIVDGRLCLKGIKRIDRKIGDSYRRTELTGNEILTVVRGATGQTVRSEANCIGMNVTRGIAVIRYDPSLIDPDYLVSYMNSDDGQRYIADHTQGATLQQINIADLKAMPIPAPSLKSQQRFAAFAAQVDKSRFIAQQQIEKLQMLYDSLAQDYFGD